MRREQRAPIRKKHENPVKIQADFIDHKENVVSTYKCGFTEEDSVVFEMMGILETFCTNHISKLVFSKCDPADFKESGLNIQRKFPPSDGICFIKISIWFAEESEPSVTCWNFFSKFTQKRVAGTLGFFVSNDDAISCEVEIVDYEEAQKLLSSIRETTGVDISQSTKRR